MVRLFISRIIALLAIGGFFFALVPFAEAWCLPIINLGDTCTVPESPPTPSPSPAVAPKPEISIYCDTRGNAVPAYRGSRPCADTDHIRKDDLVTIEGKNFAPGKAYKLLVYDGNTLLYSLLPIPYPPPQPVAYVRPDGTFVAIIKFPSDQVSALYRPDGKLQTGRYLFKAHDTATCTSARTCPREKFAFREFGFTREPHRGGTPPVQVPPAQTVPLAGGPAGTPALAKDPPVTVPAVKPDLDVEIVGGVRVLSIGNTFEIRGSHFAPTQKLTGIMFAGDNGMNMVFPVKSAIAVKNDASIAGTILVPPDAHVLLPEGTERGTITAKTFVVDGFGYAFAPNRARQFTLEVPCPTGVLAKLKPEKTALDFSVGVTVLNIEGEGFTCGDAYTAAFEFVGSDEKGLTRLASVSTKSTFSKTGTLAFRMEIANPRSAIPPTVKELRLVVTDAHGRSAKAVFTLTHVYALGVDPVRAKPGDLIRFTRWDGLTGNARVNAYFEGELLKSTMLSLDTEIMIPKTATNGWRTIALGAFNGLGPTISAPIEIYGGKDTLEPAISLNPEATLPGESVMIRGTDWKLGDKKILLTTLVGEDVPLGAVRNICAKSLGGRGCEEGEIRYSIIIPVETPPGDYAVMVFGDSEKAGGMLRVLPARKIEAKKPELVLDPTSGTPGTTVAASGGGFPPKSGLFATFDADKLSIGNAFGVTPDSRGMFTTTFVVPHSAQPGPHTVLFSNGVNASASATFVVYGAEEPKEPIDDTPKNQHERLLEKPGDSKTLDEPTKVRELIETKTYGETGTRLYGETKTRSYEDLKTKPYGTIETSTYGDAKAPSYGNVETKVYGDTATSSYGDVKAPSYGTVETKIYGDAKAPSYGTVETKAYGDTAAPSYGGVKAPSYDSVETKTYGDVPTKTYGDVPAPSFKEPQTTPNGCNSNVPSYSQPPECKPTSMLERARSVASIFEGFRSFLSKLFKRKTEGPVPASAPVSASAPAAVSGEEPAPSSDMPAAPERASNAPIPEARKDAPQEAAPKSKTVSASSNKETTQASAPEQAQREERRGERLAKTPRPDLAGSYRCYSYNVSGGGSGNCRLFQPVVLRADGTYSVSSEAGTYHVAGDTIVLSESKLRGPGMLLEGNLQIRFEYDYNGWHHTITYLKEAVDAPILPEATRESTRLDITLRVTFPEGDYSADSVNTVTLFDEGGAQVAQALAYAIDRSTIEAWFGKRSPKTGLPAGAVLTVKVGSGFGDWKVGELDLRSAKDGQVITIAASSR